MNPRTKHLSSFRNLRAIPKPLALPAISSPVGADSSMTVADQAKALKKKSKQR